MSDTIRYGVVGVRNIGKGHVWRIQEAADSEVVAVADQDESRLADVKKDFGVERLYTDADELFADPDIDAVILALPNHLHAPMTIRALEAGKHVLVEKPICRNSEEAQTMIEARDRTGLQLMVGMNQRFKPLHYAVRQAIRGGAIGDLQYGRTWWRWRRIGEGIWNRGEWFTRPETSGGGPMIDLGIHRLDLALFLLGFPEVQSVTGITTSGIGSDFARQIGKTYEVEDGGIGMIRFKNGSVLELEASYFQNTLDEGQGTILHGTLGSVQLPADDPLLTHDSAGTTPFELTVDEADPKSIVDHFTNVLLGKEQLSSTAEQGLQGLRIIEAIYESSRTGQTVTFDGP